MKIAIVLNTSWNIYNFRLGLVKKLISEGNSLYAIAPHDDYSEKLENIGCSYFPVRMDSRGINPLKDLALLFELFSIYRKLRPDVILHYTIKPNIYGTMAARLLGIPVINNVCGLGTAFLKKNILSKLVVTLYKIAFRSSGKIFFQNNEDKKFFEKVKIVRKDQSEVLPGSGIDPEIFKPAGRIVKNKKFTFLLISRLIHDKGILEYIEAIKMLKEQNIDANFQLLGPKDPKHRRGIPEELIDQWMANNIVDYLGSTDDVKPFIEKADCVVLPSYREGTPRTLLEAASFAKPIITTRVAGCTNIVIDNQNGFLCKVKNSVDLAEKMNKMAGLDEKERVEMGINSRNRIEQVFDEKIVISKYLNAIDKLGR